MRDLAGNTEGCGEDWGGEMNCPIEGRNGVHDCTGADLCCPCGYKPSFPRFNFDITIYDRNEVMTSDGFGTDCQEVIAGRLEGIARTLRSRARSL
jgi:hypothetical protein